MIRLVARHAWAVARRFAAVLAVMSVAVAPAAAQSPDGLAAARELMTVMRSGDQFKAIMPSIMQALKPAIVQNRPDVDREFDALVPKLMDAMNSRVDEMLEKIAGIYARNFTVAEIKEITAFYRGPTGQKFVQRLPNVMQESLTVGQQFGRTIGVELQSRMVDELRKKGYAVGDPTSGR